MEPLAEPYTITYPQITAVTDRKGGRVELIEFFDCVGGAMWSLHHYVQSPLVRQARCVGNTMRYLLDPGQVTLTLAGSRFPAGISGVRVLDQGIEISYLGMGGGGSGQASAGPGLPGWSAAAMTRAGEERWPVPPSDFPAANGS
jgi:hypothetical protein